MLIVTGSRALYHHRPDLVDPDTVKDWDFIGDWDSVMGFIARQRDKVHGARPLSANKYYANIESFGHCEFEIAWPGTTSASLIEKAKSIQPPIYMNQKLYNDSNRDPFPFWMYGRAIELNGNGYSDIMSDKQFDENDLVIFAQPELCLALKLSHRYLKNSPHFSKTMKDIHTMRSAGIKLSPALELWALERQKETLSYQHPNLKRSKHDFFVNETVEDRPLYVYDHDDIHEAIKRYTYPAYQYYKVEDAEVECSKELFDRLPPHVQDAGVLEECYVLMLERCLIPSDFKVATEIAFKKALEKVCTSITSGWFREYAWENYSILLTIATGESIAGAAVAVAKFKEALRNGQVRPYTGR